MGLIARIILWGILLLMLPACRSFAQAWKDVNSQPRTEETKSVSVTASAIDR